MPTLACLISFLLVRLVLVGLESTLPSAASQPSARSSAEATGNPFRNEQREFLRGRITRRGPDYSRCSSRMDFRATLPFSSF